MCEYCDKLKTAMDSGDKKQIDIAEYEWLRAQLENVDCGDGAMTRFHASNEFIDPRFETYENREKIVTSLAKGLLALMLKRLTTPGSIDVITDHSFVMLTTIVERMIERTFWFGIHSAERNQVMRLFSEVEDGS